MSEWINQYKSALVNQDASKLEKLSQKFNEQNFKNLSELQEVEALILQAKEIFNKKAVHIKNEISKLKNAQKYISDR
ncbi:hypothetical protein CCAL9344_00195 [Campylobacter sp. RM9344]|uniref:Uncharacterized protein n=1 Tax=Campylobacter californiensis TaxID=1032243 RepID=A0AAW3ZRA4_9BACT|nr:MULTISPECIES: hypothetical protein [unclassified Campylobacter]MBE2983769.1 hypothetical protein [Campylobacter sp. RM6883]MBE2985667.1 hypothetical protein [Campylobacter sp. RM12919]MBE2987304.1 hypothetical protein [Campylobacter sp. RM12920]MBE2994308.1 hypothetical protein [Campylobacter sp. RM6913]MBE3028616.1 hypothetical protein [Campylobacter sp. RM9344]